MKGINVEYVPQNVQHLNLPETSLGVMTPLESTSIVRRLELLGAKIDGSRLLMTVKQTEKPLAIACDHPMVFGTETVSAKDYFWRVIERGDVIDAVLHPALSDVIPVALYWIHIEYADEPTERDVFSRKEDGLFALRTKAGEKAERRVARLLQDNFGHTFPQGRCDSPGYFEIRYDGKKNRKPDLTCLSCGLTFEVKKRNKDQNFRISHSAGRPFGSENSRDGWHAFVFPDMEPRFIPNSAIAKAIANGNFNARRDQYDSWADIDPTSVVVVDPPQCSRKSKNALEDFV